MSARLGTWLRDLVVYYSPIALLVLVWDLLLRTGLVSAELLPSPGAAMESFGSLAASGELGKHSLVSFYRELVGLVSSVVIGTVLGISMARIEWLRLLFRPVVMFLYPMPKSALIPVLLLWFGIGDMSKIAAIFLGCLLPVVTSSFNGARGVEPQLVWSARSLGTSRAGVLWKVIFMAALPEILSGVRIALALSWLLLVSAELLISRNGLGFLISFYGENADYGAMFAAVIVVVLIGFLSDRLFLAASRWLLRWRELPAA